MRGPRREPSRAPRLSRTLRRALLLEMRKSIAHEVNQPLTGISINANACQRWLAGDSPNFAETREAAGAGLTPQVRHMVRIAHEGS